MAEKTEPDVTHATALKRVIDLMLGGGDLDAGLLEALGLCLNVTRADKWIVLREFQADVPIAAFQHTLCELSHSLFPQDIFAQPNRNSDFPRLPPDCAGPESLRLYRSCLSAPVKLRSGLRIAIVLLSRNAEAFSDCDVSLLRQVALLIENAVSKEHRAQIHQQFSCGRTSDQYIGSTNAAQSNTDMVATEPSFDLVNRQQEILHIIDELLCAPIGKVNPAILQMLARIGGITAIDRAQVWRLRETGQVARTHEWLAPGTESATASIQEIDLGSLSAWWSSLSSGEAVQVSDVQAARGRFKAHEPLWMWDAQSLLLIPMMRNADLVGLVVLQAVRGPRQFRTDEIDIMRIVANAANVVLERVAVTMDVHAKRVALSDEQDRLHATLSVVPDLVLEFDITGCIIGYFAGADVDKTLLSPDLVGHTPEEVFPKDLAALTRETMQRVDRDSAVIEREFDLTLDGKERRYRVIASPRSNQNVLAGYICVVRDITERMIERRQLRRLSKVAELTSNLVIIMDARQQIKWINPAFEKRTGWTLKEMRGHYPAEFLTLNETDPQALKRMQHAFATGQATQLELQRRSRSGQDFWVNAEIQPLFLETGELDGFISVQTDITNLKRSYRQALKERALALDASSDGIAFSSADGYYTYMNAAHRSMFGIRPDEDIRKLHWRELCQPEALISIMTDVWPKLQATGRWKGELLGLHRDGNKIFQEVSLTLYENGLMCITRDISERVMLEEERTQLRERLQIAQRRETIAFLASGVAHDLNNLVAVINGSVSLLEHCSQDNEKAEIGLVRILRATAAIKDLVGGLSSLARSEKFYSILDLRKIIYDGLGLLGTARTQGHPITTDLPEQFCPVWANSTELLQVFVNLVLNACDATGEGLNQVKIAVPEYAELPSRKPDAGTVFKDAEYVLFTVSDSGIGMNMATRQRIFESYFTTKTEAGHGLGLPIVINILRENYAALWVESICSVGTTITVAWPSHRIERKPQNQNRIHEKNVVDLKGHNVLVVDDLPDVAEVFCDMLEAAGAVGVAVSDPYEAQTLLREHPDTWSVLVTDLDMPSIRGTELAHIATTCFPPIPTVLVTATNLEPDGDADLFYSILTKPIEKSQLISAVYAAACAGLRLKAN